MLINRKGLFEKDLIVNNDLRYQIHFNSTSTDNIPYLPFSLILLVNKKILTKQLILLILKRASGLIDVDDIAKVCMLSNIERDDEHNINLKNSIHVTLNKFIKELSDIGGNIIIVMLFNLFNDFDLKVLKQFLTESSLVLFHPAV